MANALVGVSCSRLDSFSKVNLSALSKRMSFAPFHWSEPWIPCALVQSTWVCQNDIVVLLWARWHQLDAFYFDLFPAHSALALSFRFVSMLNSVNLFGFCSPFKRIISPFFHLTIYSQFDQQQPQQQRQQQTIEVTLTESVVNGWKLMGIQRTLKYTFKLQMLLYCFESDKENVPSCIVCNVMSESWNSANGPATNQPTDGMTWISAELSFDMHFKTYKHTHTHGTRNDNRHKSHWARSSQS